VPRSTRQRRLLVDLVESRRRAFTAEELWADARASAPVSLATVYRTLALLEREEKVRRLDRGRFIACEPGHHHHLVCRNCGRTVEVEGPAVERWAEKVGAEHGFVRVTHNVEVFGTCPDCAALA